MTPPVTPPSNTGSQYFDRRGEVNELKQGLRGAITERSVESLRENIKKVIMYMTLGIDMSRLFSEMVMASQLGDTVMKKMVYLYLTTYAEQNADLAILAINTLQKDTKDVDPSVRGLALRSLCSLQLSNMVEYLEPAINAGLSDPSGYVRKTAVLGVLKFAGIGGSAGAFEPTIKSMLTTDPDSMVVSNCLSVLTELGSSRGLVSQELVYSLLNRFPQFSEWAKCQAIESIISEYYPQNDEELFDLMNALDVFLKQTSAPVSFAIFKLFLNWTSANRELHHQVMTRIKDPMLTLLSASCMNLELQFAILQQIELLVKTSNHFRSLMNPHWKSFLLCDFNTQSSSKLKLLILSHLEPRPELLSELCSYVCREKISANAVETLVHLAASSDVGTLIDLLVNTAQTQPNVAGFCVNGIGNILRKFPENASQVTEIPGFIDDLFENEALWSDSNTLETLCWMLGKFEFDDAPYQLEAIFEHRESIFPKLLVPSVVELFLKRPLETRTLLEKVFAHTIDQVTDPDSRDVALMYFRMLRTVGPTKLKTLFSTAEENNGVLNESSATVSETEDLLIDFNKVPTSVPSVSLLG
jgi:AP-4 complex subunit beta-1